MRDYDMPMIHNDIKDLNEKGLIEKDKDGNEFIKYK